GLGEAVGHGLPVSRPGIMMPGSSLLSAAPHPLHSKSSLPPSSPFGSRPPPLPPIPSGVLTPLISLPLESPHPLSPSPVRWSSPPVPLSLRERGNEARSPSARLSSAPR